MVLLLIGFAAIDFLGSPNLFLIAAAVIGCACAGLAQWGPPRARSIVCVLAIEEICISAVALGSSPYPQALLVRFLIFALALALAAALLLRLPLPERNLPLRGEWLRRLLAAVALLGLVQGGPSQYVWENRWPMVWHPGPGRAWASLPYALLGDPMPYALLGAPSLLALLAAVAAGGWLLMHAWAFLVRGVPRRSPAARSATS